MNCEITKDFFIEYAEKIYDFYVKRKEIKAALANIGLNADNLLNLNDCFKKINHCFSIEFLTKNKNFDVLFDEIENKNINIDKTKFINIMNKFESFTKKIDDSSYKIRKLTDNEWDVFFPTEASILCELLNKIFNCELSDDLGYFVYELEFGKKWEKGVVTDVDGNDIPLKNSSDLYDMLIDDYEKKDCL